MLVQVSLLLLIAAARSAEACSGNFSALTGVIQSPNYPNDHGNNENCTYVITAPEGYRVMLNFTSLDLESCCDKVQIRDGGSVAAPLLGNTGYQSAPFTQWSSGNQLWLRFTSDGSITNSGFSATYTAVDKKNESFLLIASKGDSSYSNRAGVYRVDLDTRSYSRLPMFGGTNDTLAVDYDPVEERVYWVESAGHRYRYESRIRSSLLGRGTATTILAARSKNTSYSSSSSEPAIEGIAVDPLSRLIFYTDAMSKRVTMVTMSSPHQRKTVATSDVDRPRAIVLDTANGVVYWTDVGTPAKIERANYDGSDRRTVVSTDLTSPNGLAIDVPNNKLYWVDGGSNRVESSDLDGNNRTVLYTQPNSSYSGYSPDSSFSRDTRQYLGLALFENSLYITYSHGGSSSSSYSYYSGYVLKMSLAANNTNATEFLSLPGDFSDIYGYHGKMLESGPNGCGSNKRGCSDICIPLPSNRSKCACPDGKEFGSNGTTCVDIASTCGGNFTALNGTITSPNFPGEHDNDLNCTYLITAPEGYRITLTFTHLDLETETRFPSSNDDPGCDYDYVEIREGGHESALLMGRFCNEEIPFVQRSFGNRLLIRLVTDSSISSSGFSATYTSEAEDDDHFFLIARGIYYGGEVLRVDPDTLAHYTVSRSRIPYSPEAVDYDPVEERVYWSEESYSHLGSQIYSSDLNGGNVESVLNVTNKNSDFFISPDGQGVCIAVDPLSRLIFYTDPFNQWVAMLTMTRPRQRKTVASSKVVTPRTIVLDPVNGVVYWTDVGSINKIERANYDGSDRRTVVSTDLTSPFGLAIDIHNRKLYWADTRTGLLESSDLDGGDRTVLYRKTGHFRRLYGLHLFNNSLYFAVSNSSQYGYGTLYLVKLSLTTNSTTNSSTNVTQVLTFPGPVKDIHIYPGKKALSGRNGCGRNNGGCSNICIPLPSNGSKCACPGGQELSANGTTCVDTTTACGGNFTAPNGTFTSPNFPGEHDNDLNCTYLITAPEGYRITLTFTHLDLESAPYNTYMYFGQSNCIYDFVEIHDGGDDTAPVFGRYCNERTEGAPNVQSFGNRLFLRLVTDSSITNTGFSATYRSEMKDDYFFLVPGREFQPQNYTYEGKIFRIDTDTLSYYAIPMSRSLNDPEALDYDPVEEKVYWIENGSRIVSSNLDGGSVTVFLNFISSLSAVAAVEDIAVDPLSRLIFFTDAQNKQIAMVTMSNPHKRKLVARSNVDRPRAIVLDTANGVVFWTDVGTPAKIERANYDGSDRRTVVSGSLTSPNVLAIDVTNKKLYWVDSGSRSRVGSSDLDGSGTNTLYSRPFRPSRWSSYNKRFYGLAFFQDSLYLIDKQLGYSHSTVEKLPMGKSGATPSTILTLNGGGDNIHAYHQKMDSGPNGCGNNKGGCSAICIPLPNNGSKCACPTGHQLAPDGKSCEARACGGNYTALNGTILSPNFPVEYDDNLNCSMVITAPEGYRVTLTFSHLDLTPGSSYSSSTCDGDYIEIRDGGDENAPLFGRYCDGYPPFVQRSFGKQLWMRFVTDSSGAGSGFNATYVSERRADYFLLVASSSDESEPYDGDDVIFRMDPDTATHYPIPLSDAAYKPMALDYDPVEQRIYWTEKGPVVNRIRSAFLNGSHPQNVSIVVKDASQAALDGIAVDPVSRLIFYTDAGHHEIVMLTMSNHSQHRTVATFSEDKPRAIVLDTANGVLYWTVWGVSNKIERANYDGSDRRTVVNMTSNYTNGLAIDVPNNKLYWVDAGTSLVESSDLDGNNRTVLYRGSSFQHYFGLALLQDSLYITDWGYSGPFLAWSSLLKVSLSGEDVSMTRVFGHDVRLNDIHAYHQAMSDRVNGCGQNKGGCEAICIPLPSNNSKCACPDGESLSHDGKTCVPGNITTPTTATTTTTIATPIPSNATATIRSSASMPFATNGSRDLRLTCDIQPPEPAIAYTWSRPCVDQDRVCVFTPALKDNETVVTCNATLSNGRLLSSSPFNVTVGHPPPEAPVITGYSNETKWVGDNLTLTCTVRGGYPLVTSVNLTCEKYPDNATLVLGRNAVSSVVYVRSLRAEDNGTTCVCTADWKDPSLYTLNDSLTLLVNEAPRSGKSTGGKDSSAGAIVGAVIGVIVVVVIVVVVVVFIVRRRRRQRGYDDGGLVSQAEDLNPALVGVSNFSYDNCDTDVGGVTTAASDDC